MQVLRARFRGVDVAVKRVVPEEVSRSPDQSGTASQMMVSRSNLSLGGNSSPGSSPRQSFLGRGSRSSRTSQGSVPRKSESATSWPKIAVSVSPSKPSRATDMTSHDLPARTESDTSMQQSPRVRLRSLTPSPCVQRRHCPANTSVRTVVFWDPMNEARGPGTELIGCRTACPTNTPVRTVYFEDLSFAGHGGHGGGGGVLGVRLFAVGALATAHSDPLWVRTCFGCVNGAGWRAGRPCGGWEAFTGGRPFGVVVWVETAHGYRWLVVAMVVLGWLVVAMVVLGWLVVAMVVLGWLVVAMVVLGWLVVAMVVLGWLVVAMVVLGWLVVAMVVLGWLVVAMVVLGWLVVAMVVLGWLVVAMVVLGWLVVAMVVLGWLVVAQLQSRFALCIWCAHSVCGMCRCYGTGGWGCGVGVGTSNSVLQQKGKEVGCAPHPVLPHLAGRVNGCHSATPLCRSRPSPRAPFRGVQPLPRQWQ